ncbi:MAG: substrate-binding domain-containing protein, partial [Chloroflexota bacterium]
ATTSSENDAEIAAGIAGNPNAIGFLGHGQYVANEADLKVLSVNGVAPSAATVADGSYPLARPLYLYTSNQIMQTNQAASVFVNYYLTHVSSQIEKVGYFPAAAADLGRAQRNWISSNNLELAPGQWGTLDPEGIGGRIVVVGSSTVAPLTTRMAGLMGGSGYVGKVQLATDGTTAGFAAFCAGEADIVNASRPIRAEELKACRGNGRFPVEMQIGTDALAVVVSKDHSYLSDVSTAQLEQIFSSATSWSDVNASWGSDSIARFIPGVNSGTLDVFTAQVFNTDLQALPKEELVGLLEANISTGLGRRFEREQRFYADSLVFEDEALFAEVCASDEPPAACALEARSQENVYSLIVERIVSPDVVNTWSLIDSIFNRSSIEEQMLADYPGATLEFRSWLTGEFIVSPQSSTPELAGVRTAIFGSLWVVFITIVFSFPVGVGAAIYLEEYATDNALNRLIQTNINN